MVADVSTKIKLGIISDNYLIDNGDGTMDTDTHFIIITVHFRGCLDTITCINSLLKINYTNYKIIIVDNSIENNQELKLECFTILKRVQMIDFIDNINYIDFFLVNNIKTGFLLELIKIKTINKGFAAANNLAIKYLNLKEIKYDWLWFLNNDTVVEINILKKLNYYFYMNDNSKIGLVGCDIFQYYDRKRLQSIGGKIGKLSFGGKNIVPDIYAKETCEMLFYQSVDYIIGASMFVKNEFIKSIGLMNEIYFLYYEEIDWALRGKQKGWHLGYCFGAKVYHKEGASIGVNNDTLSKSDIADYYSIRSKILFVKLFYPKKQYLLTISLIISFFIRIFHGYFKRAFRLFTIFKQVLLTT